VRAALVVALVLVSACQGAAPAPSDSPIVASPTATVEPAYCDVADVLTAARGYGDFAKTALDHTNALPPEYAPPDLVPVTRAGFAALAGERVRAIAVPDLTALREAAARDGVTLAVFSGYRSYAEQKATLDHWVQVGGYEGALRTSARAGHSEHQLGTALDLGTGPKAPWEEPQFASGPAGRWLATHATEYGFVLSYPEGKERVTCYAFEPWHFRWVGRDVAARVKASGLTLREFLAG